MITRAFYAPLVSPLLPKAIKDSAPAGLVWTLTLHLLLSAEVRTLSGTELIFWDVSFSC